jgi:hypothetical protein
MFRTERNYNAEEKGSGHQWAGATAFSCHNEILRKYF